MSRLPLLMVLVGALAQVPAADPPLFAGDDFYPSPERPVGFRGDGSGYFPGARIVTEWWEGTPAQVEWEYTDKRGRKDTEKAWVFTDEKSHNIVWKAELPAWANGHPVVVGDRVFTLGEPDYLFCHDANSGELLWTRRCNPWQAAGTDPGTAEKLQTLYDLYEDGIPLFNKMTSGGTTSNQVEPAVFKDILQTFLSAHWPEIRATLDKLAPGPDWQQLMDADVADIEAYCTAYEQTTGRKRKLPKVRSEVRKALGKQIDRLSEHDVPIDVPWGHMVGWCAMVPVSDGERVYASFGQGGILCCDLEGKVLWTAYSQPSKGGTTTQSLQAPLLCDGVLIDPRNKGELRGFEAATGKQLWATPTANASNSSGRKGGYYVGNHAIVPLATDAGVDRVLVTTLCNIIRPSDGKELGFLPWPHDYGPSGGPSVMWSGNRVYRASNGDGGGCPFTGYELSVTGPDTVSAEIIFQLGEKGSPGYMGQVCTPEVLIMRGDRNVLSPDGSQVKQLRRFGGYSQILAGTTFLSHPDGNRYRFMSYWGKRRGHDGQAIMDFTLYDFSDPMAPRPIAGRRLLGGKNMPRVPAMERWAAQLYAHPEYWGQCYGKPAHLIHTDTAVFPMANRLFIKTVGHLYCIGDPDKAYSWNPSSRDR